MPRLGGILLMAGALVVFWALPSSHWLAQHSFSKYWQLGLESQRADTFYVLYSVDGRYLVAGGALTAIAGAALVLRALL